MPKTNRKKETRPDKSRRKMNSGVLWIGAGVAIIVVIVVVGLLAARGSSAYAQVGDHWHAPITVSVCGEKSVPPNSLIQTPSGNNFGMHSHGDGRVHIEPSTASSAGNNAKMKRFFDSLEAPPVRFNISNTSIQIPGGKLYTNGDACPDGKAGALVATVNGNVVKDILGYHPKDQDRINISFS